jgi:hypothetical protein
MGATTLPQSSEAVSSARREHGAQTGRNLPTASEKNAKLAQMLGQPQPFLAVLSLECVGQLASLGPA